jgi:hypothetical protein
MFRASVASCGEENGRKKETARRVRTVKIVRTLSFVCFVASARIVYAVYIACNAVWHVTCDADGTGNFADATNLRVAPFQVACAERFVTVKNGRTVKGRVICGKCHASKNSKTEDDEAVGVCGRSAGVDPTGCQS